MKTCLIVGNQTLPGAALAEVLRQRLGQGDRTYYVVVPLVPVVHGATWDERESAEASRKRLEQFLAHLREQGAEADGEIGDRDPLQAVKDVLRVRDVDDIILSTLAPGISRWLQLDIPSRLQRAVDIPVTVVTQEAPAATPA